MAHMKRDTPVGLFIVKRLLKNNNLPNMSRRRKAGPSFGITQERRDRYVIRGEMAIKWYLVTVCRWQRVVPREPRLCQRPHRCTLTT